DHQAAGEGGRAASRRARLRVLRSGAHAAVRGRLDRRRHAAMKTPNQKAWWLVVPVVLLVAFNALIPLMTVINYSVQETFGENVFFFEGVKWFQAVLHSERGGHRLQLYAAAVRRLGHAHRDGRLALDFAGGPSRVRWSERDPGRLLPGCQDRRGLERCGLPLYPAAEDEARADHRRAAPIHGQLHDLHRAHR